MIKKYIFGIAAFLVTLFILSQGKMTGYFVKEEPLIIYFPKIADFKNTEQGGINFGFNFPDASFKVGDREADFLLFLESETIPQLKIGYDPKEKIIRGGLPLMSTHEVNLLDGQQHDIIYTFHRAEHKQMIVLDDKVLAEGEFTGEATGDMITGHVVYAVSKKVLASEKIDVSVW